MSVLPSLGCLKYAVLSVSLRWRKAVFMSVELKVHPLDEIITNASLMLSGVHLGQSE